MPESTTDHDSQSQSSQVSLEHRLNQYPQLRARVEQLLKVVENSSGDIELADDAEQLVINQVRSLGLDVLQLWAVAQQEKKASQLCLINPSAHKDEKKDSTGIPHSEK